MFQWTNKHWTSRRADSNMVIQDLLSQDVTFISQPLNHDHKLQLMSMTRDIMTMFWSNLILTPKNIWCCDGKMNILCITTFTFYPTRETSSWRLHWTFTFTFYFSWQRDWCLLVGVCGNVCAISTNTSHYQPQSDNQLPDYCHCQHSVTMEDQSGSRNLETLKSWTNHSFTVNYKQETGPSRIH